MTILEDDVPTTYVKVPDPENEEEFVYIPEDDVPLFGFEIPETGDSGRTVLWAALSAVSLTGIVVLPDGVMKDAADRGKFHQVLMILNVDEENLAGATALRRSKGLTEC